MWHGLGVESGTSLRTFKSLIWTYYFQIYTYARNGRQTFPGELYQRQSSFT